MEKKRNQTIDFMRGFAMVLIILIHVTVYFRDNIVARTLWEYSQVAVPIFVFCSAYIYFSRTKQEHFSISYFWKRIKRLVLPYYFFLLILFLYNIFLKKIPFNFDSIVRKILFLNISSRDIDWLVVLFLYFMILMPLIRILGEKKRLLWIFAGIGFVSSIILLFITTEIAFRLVMWLPWSIVLIVSYLIVRYEHIRWFMPISMVSFAAIYFLSRIILIQSGQSIVLTENKYPPNIFYLSYGIFLLLITYRGCSYIRSLPSILQKAVNFLSSYSYSIFFIHFLLLYYFLDFTDYKKMQWWELFGYVLVGTVAIQLAINHIQKFISSRY